MDDKGKKELHQEKGRTVLSIYIGEIDQFIKKIKKEEGISNKEMMYAVSKFEEFKKKIIKEK